MGIAHGYGQAAMTENLLQRENVAAPDHEVRGEGVPQHMGKLHARA